jgi:Lipocalin-like domain
MVFKRSPAASTIVQEDAMKRTLISAAAIVFLVSLVQPAAAEDLASSIVGTWKMTSWDRKEIGTGKTIKEYGEQPVGYIMYTKGGRLIVFTAAEGRKTPAKPVPTDAERIELFNTMYGYSGTYKVEGNNKLVYRLDGSWNQAWTGRDIVRQAEIAGNKLTLVTPTFKGIIDGQDIVVTTIFERLE